MRNGHPEERFIVTSLTGYPINPSAWVSPRNQKKSTEWYVLDTAYCYEIVGVYRSTSGKSGEQLATARCEHLNRLERRWEALGA